MTDIEHHHHLVVANVEPAPEGLNGRTFTFNCTDEDCDHTHQAITLRSDDEIQTELDAYNTGADA